MSTAAQMRVDDAEAEAAAREEFKREQAAKIVTGEADAAVTYQQAAGAPSAKPPMVNADGTPTPAGWRAIGKLFREEMPVKQRPGRGATKFDYITARQVADRLDGVIGPGNWQTSFRVLDLAGAAVECTLTIYGVSKSDVGFSNNPDAEHETEALKASYSDAFKRAAVHWGIGRWLYKDT